MSDAATTPASHSSDPPPLDDVMLAMDVVDTLRRRERLVLRELDDAGREEDLKQRLRRIYAQQGIDVPDEVIDQGVAALKEERFTYKPPKEGITTKLARVYIRRGRWGKWVGGGIGAGLLALATNYFAFVLPDKALPGELTATHAEVQSLAKSDNARSVLDQVFNAGNTALRNEDLDATKSAITQMNDLRTTLEQEYTIQIVNRPGERSGVWRIPDVNSSARNHYIVVEAVDATGNTLAVPIKNEETGKTERVKAWGLRVDEATFQSVGNDKQDNGIIERDRFGFKQRGYLEPSYEMPTTGAAITKW